MRAQGPRERAVHARAQVAVALLAEQRAVFGLQATQQRVRGVGRGAQLQRVEAGGGRLLQRMHQQPLGQCRRAGFAQHRRQPRLGKAGHRRLGHHDQAAAHRYSRASTSGGTPRQ